MKETAYLLQAALVSVWWVSLASSQACFDAFQFTDIPATAFWSFFVPDVVMIAILSTIRAYRKSRSLELIILGAFGYASLYCFNATLLTGSGFLPTGLMLLGFAYNLFLCFNDSMFRTSTSTCLVRNGVKTATQIVCIWLLALVVVPFVILDAFDSLAWPEPGIWLVFAVVLLISCSALGLTSAWFMVRDGGGTPLPLDQTSRLVVSGPYRFVRNPMAIAGIGQGLSIAIAMQSLAILVYSIIGAIIWQMVVRPIEERNMVERFGDSYVAYRQRVSCWIPTFRSSAV